MPEVATNHQSEFLNTAAFSRTYFYSTIAWTQESTCTRARYYVHWTVNDALHWRIVKTNGRGSGGAGLQSGEATTTTCGALREI